MGEVPTRRGPLDLDHLPQILRANLGRPKVGQVREVQSSCQARPEVGPHGAHAARNRLHPGPGAPNARSAREPRCVLMWAARIPHVPHVYLCGPPRGARVATRKVRPYEVHRCGRHEHSKKDASLGGTPTCARRTMQKVVSLCGAPEVRARHTKKGASLCGACTRATHPHPRAWHTRPTPRPNATT